MAERGKRKVQPTRGQTVESIGVLINELAKELDSFKLTSVADWVKHWGMAFGSILSTSRGEMQVSRDADAILDQLCVAIAAGEVDARTRVHAQDLRNIVRGEVGETILWAADQQRGGLVV